MIKAMPGPLKFFIPSFLFDWYHKLWPFLGALLYRFPTLEIIVIGVTGTNGKSSVVHMSSEVLEGAGHKVASLSSIRFKIADKEWPNTLKMTMPGRMKLQKFLRMAVDAGCKYAVIEVTSEGIAQHRHDFIDFTVAVFTNLAPEHIESHGSFKQYNEAKQELFKKAKIHIINVDEPYAEDFLRFPAQKKFGYGKDMRYAPPGIPIERIQARDVAISSFGADFSLRGEWFHLNLLGEFNIYNALAAICVGLTQGVSLKAANGALQQVQSIPGRMNIVIYDPFYVIVDYAHTPDALQKVYKTVRGSGIKASQAKMVCVFGAAGGGRDKWKRNKMGKIAAEYCDEVVLTNEDPYKEDPQIILDQIEKGIAHEQGTPLVLKVLDRRQAIHEALKRAKASDVVVITGKGSEPWMMVKEGRLPWSDRDVVEEEFQKIQKSQLHNS